MMNTLRSRRGAVLTALLLIASLLLAACATAEPVAEPTEAPATEMEATEAPTATEAMEEQPTEEQMEEPTEAPTATEEPAMEAGVEISVSDVDAGTILVGPEGLSLYILTADNPGESTCTGGCADAWPPLTTEGEPQAGEGADASLLGTLERQDGSTQVTYNGWPLYYYSGDSSPGDAAGQGFESFGGTWWLLGPDGEPVNGDGGGAAADGDNGEDVDDLY